MVILSVSDVVEKELYRETTRDSFSDTDLVIGCGDLPYYYLEFLADALNTPVLFVRGNHAAAIEYGSSGTRTSPLGAVNLHRRVIQHDGVIFAGLEGAMRYRPGEHLYSQSEMWLMVMGLLPKLAWNRIARGRCLDILITHSPPFGIHDQKDLPHTGFKAVRWLVKVCQPAIHLHGHVRVHNRKKTETRSGRTRIINTYGYRKITFRWDQALNPDKGSGHDD